MRRFSPITKQKISKAYDRALHELDQQEGIIEKRITELVKRKADLARKREVFISLMEKSRHEHRQRDSSSLPSATSQHHRQPVLSAQSSSPLSGKHPKTFEDELIPRPANASEAGTTAQNSLGVTDLKRKLRNRIEARYRAILGEIAEQVTDDDTTLLPDTDLPQRTSGRSLTLESRSRFAEFARGRGDTHLAYRLTPGNRDDFEKIPRYNEYFTRKPIFSCESRFQPVIYVLDVEVFLKTFFDEIRHIESCIQYQSANWKKLQAKVAMNESYHVLIQLIDEIVNAYSPTLQASPASSGVNAPGRVHVRDAKSNEQIVETKHLSRKGDRLFLDRKEVTFAGYLKQDINTIFPVPTFEVMNCHILKLMRDELIEHQYEQAVEYWRACELRIQELGAHYESGLWGQLRTWLA